MSKLVKKSIPAPSKEDSIDDAGSLKKIVGKMPEEWRKKIRDRMSRVGPRDSNLGKVLKEEMTKLSQEIEAQKLMTQKNKDQKKSS